MSDRLIMWSTLATLAALLAGLCAVAFGPDLWWRLKHRFPRRGGMFGRDW